MIISHIVGGLGNQMFQYAIARSLSLTHGLPWRLDTDAFRYVKQHQGYLLSTLFDLNIVEASTSDIASVLGPQWWLLPRRLIRDRRFAVCRGRNFYEHDFEVSPLWNGNGCARHVICRVGGSRKRFRAAQRHHRPRFPLPSTHGRAQRCHRARNAGQQLGCRSCPQGDYVSTPEAAAAYEVCGPEYYRRALTEIAAKSPIDKVYFFSDDISWSSATFALIARTSSSPTTPCSRAIATCSSWRTASPTSLPTARSVGGAHGLLRPGAIPMRRCRSGALGAEAAAACGCRALEMDPALRG